MTIEQRPMFPPRAESVDSFPHQPGVDHGKAERPASDSLKPAQGLSRRAVIAGVASAAALPIAAGIPTTAAASSDPAFALIAAKLAADVAHCAAIDAQDQAEGGHGIGSAAAEEAFQRSGVACGAANEADWRLATTPPTTLAGVAAVLRLANQVEDEGGEWPGTDTIGAEGWHYQLRATMAQAIEAIFRKGDA